jgi:hypothetical protein
MHNGEPHNLYSTPNIITLIKSRPVRWAAHAARMEEKQSAYGVSVGKSEGRRPLKRSRRWCKQNIKMYHRQNDWGCGLHSSGSRQGPVVGFCGLGIEPSGSINAGNISSGSASVVYSRTTEHHGVSQPVNQFVCGYVYVHVEGWKIKTRQYRCLLPCFT